MPRRRVLHPVERPAGDASVRSRRRRGHILPRDLHRALLATLLAIPVLGAAPSAHAQLLGDVAPYFLWPDAWAGTLHGRDVVQRDVTMHGATVHMGITTKAAATVRFGTFNGGGFTETWQGKDNTATVDYAAATYMAAGGQATVNQGAKAHGVVHLDTMPADNGVTIDAVKKTFAVALGTCTMARCDRLTTSGHATVTTPHYSHSFHSSQSDAEGVEVVARGHLPAPGTGLHGIFAPGAKAAGGATDETSLSYDLHPTFAYDAWAAAYRAGYLAARQSDLAPFEKYTPEACGPETLASSPCRAAYRARRFLKANADVATADFTRVVKALVNRRCPGFTRQLNLFEDRTKDIVIEGPIATYKLVRDVLRLSITSDPNVSYQRLPDFMRCLYPYDTYRKVVTLQQPGTNPFVF